MSPSEPTPQATWFPAELVPSLQHTRVRSAPTEVHTYLSKFQLLAYLNFTVQLESGPVARVMHRLCDEDATPWLAGRLRRDAQRIRDEEIAHTIQHHAALERWRALSGQHGPHGTPAFVERLARVVRNAASVDVDWVELLFVTISETLITGNLRVLARDPRVQPEICALARQHAAEEAHHSAFFHRLWQHLCPTLEPSRQRTLARWAPALITAYLAPDHDLMLESLSAFPTLFESPDAIVRSVCASQRTRDDMIRASRPTVRLFRRIGLLSDAEADRHVGVVPVVWAGGQA